MRRILKEPLLHFFVLGALLFATYGFLNREALRSPDTIVIDNERVAALRGQFERVWQRPPTPTELDGLITSWVEEEMLYREGLALGFERDDPVIRRRVVQKVTFFSEALVDETTTDEELAAWLDAHREQYRVEPSITLRQVYFDPARHGNELVADIDAAKAALDADASASPGDATLLPASIENRSRSDVERTFGKRFAEAVFELPLGEWAGPVASGFGQHLVRVDGVEPGRDAELASVRGIVERDLLADRKRQALADLLESLQARYTVTREDDEGAVAGEAQ